MQKPKQYLIGFFEMVGGFHVKKVRGKHYPLFKATAVGKEKAKITQLVFDLLEKNGVIYHKYLSEKGKLHVWQVSNQKSIKKLIQFMEKNKMLPKTHQQAVKRNWC